MIDSSNNGDSLPISVPLYGVVIVIFGSNVSLIKVNTKLLLVLPKLSFAYIQI